MTTTTAAEPDAALYTAFLDAFNQARYEEVRDLIAADFKDHHPGFDIDGAEVYLAALRNAHETLQISGELEELLVDGDRLVTRVRLSGRHIGEVFGIPATGRPVSWETAEVWRVADGRLAERWAVDDLLGLSRQISPEAQNVAVVQRVSDAVNARRYDDLDELFAADFKDRNPAWDVESLEQLKGIIVAAHQALDFHAHLDGLYAAGPDRVVMHITFTGRHVAPFFGVQPTGKEVTWTSLEVYRLEDFKVVERWVQADTAGLMAQIGVPLPQ
jgi:predicted ester cyclase